MTLYEFTMLLHSEKAIFVKPSPQTISLLEVHPTSLWVFDLDLSGIFLLGVEITKGLFIRFSSSFSNSPSQVESKSPKAKNLEAHCFPNFTLAWKVPHRDKHVITEDLVSRETFYEATLYCWRHALQHPVVSAGGVFFALELRVRLTFDKSLRFQVQVEPPQATKQTSKLTASPTLHWLGRSHIVTNTS